MDAKNIKDWILWNKITFKTQAYRKNFDMFIDNESFVTEYEGEITQVRIEERKSPIIVGEYGISKWNIGLGEKFGVDFYELLKDHYIEDTYKELLNLIENGEFDLNEYKKIVIVHNLLLKKEYRKHGMIEEFTEMLYTDFYDDDVVVLVLVKPFQENLVDVDYYLNNRKVIIKNDDVQNNESIQIPASEYYSLGEFIDVEDNDTEMNSYKLFSVATRCGFNRICESYIFKLSPEKVINRMQEKINHKKLINENIY